MLVCNRWMVTYVTAIRSIADLQKWVSSCPFNHWLELEVIALSEAGVQIRMPWRAELVGSPTTGAVHGGVLGCLVDACAGFAIIAATGHRLATIDMRVDYHRPAAHGELTAHGEVVRLGRTIVTADCRIFDDRQAIVASGRAVYFRRAPPSA